MSDSQNTSTGVKFEVTIGGGPVETTDVMSVTVDHDLDLPAMCLITLKNPTNKFNAKFKPGDTVEVKLGGGTRRAGTGAGEGDTAPVFKGEVVGVEAQYKQGGEPKLSVRAFDKLHRLTRGKKSKTYQKQTDQDIASAIASQAGLSAQCGSTPKIKHEHVYQHNQDNLSFLRTRAARLGYSIWVDDGKMYFDAPKLDADSGLEFSYEQQPKDGKGDKLKSFNGRLSNAQVVKKVTVRGWDPEKKQEVVGEEQAKPSKLGSSNAASSLGDFGEVETYAVDRPIASVEEAKAIAKSMLDEASLSFLTAECEVMGNTSSRPASSSRSRSTSTTRAIASTASTWCAA
jgi:phage protein D